MGYFPSLGSMCRPCRDLPGILDPFPRRFPFTSFSAIAMGYDATSHRHSQQHSISPLPVIDFRHTIILFFIFRTSLTRLAVSFYIISAPEGKYLSRLRMAPNRHE